MRHPILLALLLLAACGGGSAESPPATVNDAYLQESPSLPGEALGVTSHEGTHYLIEVLEGLSYDTLVYVIAHELYHAAGNRGHPCTGEDCITGDAGASLPAAPCECESDPISANGRTVTVYVPRNETISYAADEAATWWNNAVGREAFRVLYDQ